MKAHFNSKIPPLLANDLVDALRESLNAISEQRSKNQVKKTQIKTNGSLVSKLVPCGKNCNGCPHAPYLYKVSRVYP